MAIKRVIQNRDKQYLAGRGLWTPHLSEAISFDSLSEAVTLYQTALLGDVDYVVIFSDASKEVRLNLLNTLPRTPSGPGRNSPAGKSSPPLSNKSSPGLYF